MLFSKTTTYALRIMILMAKDEKKQISAQQIHETLSIRKAYLRRLMTDLSKHGFIKSTMGRNGGYQFAGKPEEIHIYEVIDAVEGIDSLEGCILGVTNCDQSPQCVMHVLWENTRKNLLYTFKHTSLMNLNTIGLV